MAELSPVPHPRVIPEQGDGTGAPRNLLRERLLQASREAVQESLGKGSTWCRDVLNGEAGIRLDDLPAFARALGVKWVSAEKVCVDPDIAKAYDAIVRKKTTERSLLFDDAE